jgi:hypothetical protein
LTWNDQNVKYSGKVKDKVEITQKPYSLVGLASMKKGYKYHAWIPLAIIGFVSQNYVSGLPKYRNAFQWTDGRLAG